MREIWEFISQDRMKIATDFLVCLEEHITTREHFPERCPLVSENEILGTSFRHLLYGRYRTIFEMVKSRVIILRVIHASRLLDSEMFGGSAK